MQRLQLSVTTDSPFWAKVERAYELWEQYGDIDQNPTLDESATIWRVLKEEGLLKKHGNHATRTSVQGWFLDRQSYSPWVDETAVRRAMLWDAKVWEALTFREQSTVYDRVTEVPTPENSLRDEHEAWLLLPAELRNRVAKGVQQRRKRGPKRVAA